MIPYFEFELSDELGLKDFLSGIVILGSSNVVLLCLYYSTSSNLLHDENFTH